ncbi:MAG: type II toxin-antitoxin system VapC family toxin [Acidobacteriales bacterium]|nr:type II toxin-antitoxin system VapC family toxin [Terriglobales bacterium]
MSRIVLDSSVLLALLNHEPGAEKLTPELLSNAASSTVNLAEVQTKLVSGGGSPDEAWEDTLSPIREAMPFTEEQAKIAGSLVAHTRLLGLSMGDRACLALGIVLNAPIYTADRSWKTLKLGVRIHVIR